MNKQIKSKDNSSEKFDPDVERKMRLIANLIIDRIFEDKKSNSLRFQKQKVSVIAEVTKG